VCALVLVAFWLHAAPAPTAAVPQPVRGRVPSLVVGAPAAGLCPRDAAAAAERDAAIAERDAAVAARDAAIAERDAAMSHRATAAGAVRAAGDAPPTTPPRRPAASPRPARTRHDAPPPLPADAPTLSFAACNGFANQRLSLLYGLVLAKATRRRVFLPDLVADGTQLVAEGDNGGYVDKLATGPGGALAFGEQFDVGALTLALRAHGVEVAPAGAAAAVRPRQHAVSLQRETAAEVFLLSLAGMQHVAVDCPLWRVSAVGMEAHEALLLDVLAALVPSPARAALVDSVVARLRGAAGGAGAGAGAGVYDALHLRYEADWRAHCAEWEAIPDGVVRDNCGLLSAPALVAKLKSLELNRSVPLYVAVQKERLLADGRGVLQALRGEFYVSDGNACCRIQN
jgi:hypothetical protein